MMTLQTRPSRLPVERCAFVRAAALMLIFALLVSSCGILPNKGKASSLDGTPVPTPTRDPSGFQAVDTRGCAVADWNTMQSNATQGDLIAWQPGTHNIAYMAPSGRTSWYVGVLMLAKYPEYSKPVELAPNIQAAGDLTWSPDGDKIAFLAFRPNESLYTVMTVNADGTALTDLFPTDLARTDSRTSQKGILDWVDNNTVRVVSSCGEECRLGYDISVSKSSGPTLNPTPLANYRTLNESLAIHVYSKEYKVEDFPRGLQKPHWSPDDNMVAYLDRRGALWMLELDKKISYPLDMGLRDVYEMQWSSASDDLAIRAEDRIFIFEVPCRSAKK